MSDDLKLLYMALLKSGYWIHSVNKWAKGGGYVIELERISFNYFGECAYTERGYIELYENE